MVLYEALLSLLQDGACDYLESQLNLFARICWGNNGKTIYALDKDDQALITFEQTRLCAQNSALPPSLKSKYVKLMIGTSLARSCASQCYT